MNKYSYRYKIKKDGTIALYRIYSNIPNIQIPKMIDDKIVSELADHCFSTRNNHLEDTLIYGSDENLYELNKENIEYIDIPDTVTKIGSFCFYNCKKLKKIRFSNKLKQIGSDMFLNCHDLNRIDICANINEPTILKQILTQISWDIDICFNDAILFYPEYYEIYDEIGPAHIFSLNISGEGFRLRQCFKDGIVSLEEYDATFPKLCVEENKDTLAHFVMHRFNKNPDFYLEYIIQNQKFICEYILKFKSMDNQKKLDKIEFMLLQGWLDSTTLDDLITFSTNSNQVEITTTLITWKKKYFTKKQKYDFEDF